MRVIEVSARKGGVGTTVMATAIAVSLADKGERVLFVDSTKTGDVFSVLAITTPSAGEVSEATPTLSVVMASPQVLSADKVSEHDVVVVDAGVTKQDGQDYWGVKPYRVAVVRNAYLSLRNEVTNRRSATIDTLIVVKEEGAALTFADAVNVVGNGVRALEVPYSTELARAVDAGLFTTRSHLYTWAEAFHTATSQS